MSRRALASYDQNSRSYCLRILNHDYLILPENKIIRHAEAPSSHPPEFYLKLSAVNYLTGARNIPLSYTWVSEKQFPNGPLFFRGPHRMPVKNLEQNFGRNPDGFRAACLACGGKKVEGGDIACELPVFPRLPVRAILWLADEEFPARLFFLFDQTAHKHLQLDALWAVGKAIEKALLSASSIFFKDLI